MINKEFEKDIISKTNKPNYWLALLSGLLMSLSCSSAIFSWLAWLGLIPFFYTFFSVNLNLKKGFILSFVYSMTFYLGIMSWLFCLHPLTWVGFSDIQSIFILSLGWLVFSLIEALGLSFIGISYPAINNKIKNFSDGKKILLISSIWIIIEWMQGMTEAGFTFGRLAISQYNYLPVIQSSALFGTLFISGLMVAFNAALALTLIQVTKSKNENKKLNLQPLMIVISILLINIGYGYYTIYSKTDSGQTINVGIVQGNISSSDKWKTPLEVHMKTYTDLTQKLIDDNKDKKMDMIVWPETAIPFFFNHPYVTQELKGIAQSQQVYFITGVLTTKYSAEEAEKIGWVNLHEHSNSLIGIDKNGKPSNVYSKRHLVPFGEYMPFRFILEKIAPGLNKLNALKGDLLPGTDTGLITTPFGKVGGLICYESIFPQIIRDSVVDGAELLVLSTNDSWFKDSAAVYQHNAQAVFRSVENDRYMVRAANTGISSIISPVGKIISRTQPLEKAILTGKVKFRNTTTFYAKTGDIIVLLALISILTIYAFQRKKSDPKLQ